MRETSPRVLLTTCWVVVDERLAPAEETAEVAGFERFYESGLADAWVAEQLDVDAGQRQGVRQQLTDVRVLSWALDSKYTLTTPNDLIVK